MAGTIIYPLTSYQACRLLAYAGFADLDPRTHARKFRVAVYIAKILDAADEKMDLMSTLSFGQDGAPIMATISKRTEGGDMSAIIDIDPRKAYRWLRKQKIEPVAGADFWKMEDKPMNEQIINVALTHDQILTIRIALLEGMERCMRQLSAVDAMSLRRNPDGTPTYPDLSESTVHWRERHDDLRNALEAMKPTKERARTRLTNEQLQNLFDDAEQNSPQSSEPFLTVTYSEERADCAESDRHTHPGQNDLCSYPERI